MSDQAEAIQQLVDYISTGELTKAERSFQDVLNTKLSDALDAQRIATAQEIFNEVDEDEEEIVEYDDEEEGEEEYTEEDISDEDLLAEIGEDEWED